MVEVWPYAERSRGIAVFQLFGRAAAFFTTFVNPIGLDSVGWKYLISYCCWLAFEIVFVYFMFPETFGRTLEELSFSMFPAITVDIIKANLLQSSRTNILPTRLSRLSRKWYITRWLLSMWKTRRAAKVAARGRRLLELLFSSALLSARTMATRLSRTLLAHQGIMSVIIDSIMLNTSATFITTDGFDCRQFRYPGINVYSSSDQLVVGRVVSRYLRVLP